MARHNFEGTTEGPTFSPPTGRRHDVDWLRVLALILLIIYHIVISFQFWASSIKFPQNDELLPGLWPAMGLMNIWRIPLLFLISGMAVRFSMCNRPWKQLLIERTLRLGLPYVFGIIILNLFFAYFLPRWGWQADDMINFGHLWFLLNIYLYTAWSMGLMYYLEEHPDNAVYGFLKAVLRHPLGLLLLAVPLLLEAQLVNPQYYSSYVDTLHGWLVGALCFLLGYVFAVFQKEFLPAVVRVRWISLALAIGLFLLRWLAFDLQDRVNALTALESMSWMMSILAFGFLYLNRPSPYLRYLSRSLFPVYFVHLPIQFALCSILFPLEMGAGSKLILLLVGTFALSFLLQEGIRHLKWIRPLFGMKLK